MLASKKYVRGQMLCVRNQAEHQYTQLLDRVAKLEKETKLTPKPDANSISSLFWGTSFTETLRDHIDELYNRQYKLQETINLLMKELGYCREHLDAKVVVRRCKKGKR